MALGVKYKSKEFITHTHLWRICNINQSLIKSVWNYTKRYPRPFDCKLLLLLANSHCPFIIRKVISRVPNQYPKWLFSYSNHPLSIKTYWLLLIRSHSKIVPTPLPVCAMQGRLGFMIKFTVNKPRSKLAQSCNPPRAIQSRQVIHSVSIVKVNKSLGYSVNTSIS